jgi:hypothetical protein
VLYPPSLRDLASPDAFDVRLWINSRDILWISNALFPRAKRSRGWGGDDAGGGAAPGCAKAPVAGAAGSETEQEPQAVGKGVEDRGRH